MRKLIASTIVSVDGYFAGPNGEIDWFKGKHSDEDKEFSDEVSKKAGLLLFGRTTYEMMKSFWPTPNGARSDPVMAEVRNRTPKIVFSETTKPEEDDPVWKEVRVLHEIDPEGIISLKMHGVGGTTILGSGTIVQQMVRLGLIDEYQMMVVPVILGTGKYLFKDVKRLNLELIGTKVSRNGGVLVTYRPAT